MSTFVLVRLQEILTMLQEKNSEYSSLMEESDEFLRTLPIEQTTVNLQSIQDNINITLQTYKNNNNLEQPEVRIMFKITMLCDMLMTRLVILYNRINKVDDNG